MARNQRVDKPTHEHIIGLQGFPFSRRNSKLFPDTLSLVVLQNFRILVHIMEQELQILATL